MLLVDDIQIESIWMSIIGLGTSIFTKKQVEEFTTFQDSQGMRKAYLTETATMACGGEMTNNK
jgi:hypothetical protein